MRLRLGMTILLVLALVAAACGDSEGDDGGGGESCAIEDLELVAPGMLTIATGEPVFPPWMIDDDPTNKQGFESAVAYAIASEMGFADDEVQWVRTGFDQAIAPGPKSFDFNIQQYSITAERDEVVDFSDGYYTASQALIAYADSPVQDATTLDDLKPYRLGAAIGTTSLDFIEEVIEPDTEPAVYDTNADAKAAFDAGQLDGLVLDLPTAYFVTAVEIEEAAIVAQFASPAEDPEEFGLLFAEGNSLVDCVNEAIAALEDEGTLTALADEWLTEASDIRVIDE